MSELLAKIIQERWKELGMSQYQLAKLSGMEKRTIGRLLKANDLDCFQFNTIDCVATVLGLELTFTCKEQMV